MKVRITSIANKTIITEAETGRDLSHMVTEVHFTHKAGEEAQAVLICVLSEVDLVAQAERVTICPKCKAEQSRER